MNRAANTKLFAIAALAIACSSNSDALLGNDPFGPGSGKDSWGNGGGGGPSYTGKDGSAGPGQAEAIYRSKIQPMVEAKCGGACHVLGTTLNAPKYLAGPDSYLSIKAYPGIVTEDVYASKLLGRPAGHPAATLLDPGMETFKADVTTWLTAEASALAAIPLPTVGPVDLSAGSIDLSSINGMTGAKLTFSAKVVGNYARFDTLQVTAPSTTAIHVVAPIIVMVPADNSAPIKDKNFSAADLTINAGATGNFDAPYFFFNWVAGSKLEVQFTKIETATGTGDGGSVQTGCKSVATFQSSAAPELINTCVGCHGGNNMNATNALDLSKLKGNIDYAGACGQALFKVNTTNKTQSNILLAPLNGSGLNHGGGKPYGSTNSTGYQAILAWVNKE